MIYGIKQHVLNGLKVKINRTMTIANTKINVSEKSTRQYQYMVDKYIDTEGNY